MKKEPDSVNAGRFEGVLTALKTCFTGADKGRENAEKIDVGVLADRIRKTEVFRNLPDESIAGMVDHIEMLAVPASDVVVAAGAEGDFFYMIASGTAHVLRHIEGQDKTRVVAEVVTSYAMDPSRPVRELERMAPEGHPGREVLTQILDRLKRRYPSARDSTTAR